MSRSDGNPSNYINRELSWIDFNERVLALAADSRVPLLERVKFLAIFASNLDEFYMVRVAGLKRQVAAGVTGTSSDGLTSREQLDAIAQKVAPLVQRHAELFGEAIGELAAAGIKVARWEQLDDVQHKELRELFEQQIFPIVTPLAVDPAHPFPYISSLSLNLAVLVRDPESAQTHFARIKVPPLLPRFIELSGEPVFVPLEDVIAANLDKLFVGMEVVEHHAFRVTRNADLEVDDDGAEDLLAALEEELRKRRFSPAVRLEIAEEMPERILDLLMRELQVEERQVQRLPGPLDLSGLWDLHELDRPDLKDEPFVPSTHPALAAPNDTSADIFSALRENDVLVHHPYDSFVSSVERFIEQAAGDPQVHAIKQTLYRTSGGSPIVASLARAAQSGKQVVVLVEIKARFDELANIEWARTLERAGCHVLYGIVGLKTHCKLCLVVRKEGGSLRRYVHLGTGNYNTTTARLYEDLGLLTSNDQLGADVGDLFNHLTGYTQQTSFRRLIAAPDHLRDRVIGMIGRERHVAENEGEARITIKVNSLVDEDVIEALYRASQAGVKIDLIVRSVCSLKPGIPGLSEGIQVRSILGRFLEHSRILRFENGGTPEFYIGSADLMRRNLDGRIEVLVHVEGAALEAQLDEMLEDYLHPNAACWLLMPDGTWKRRNSDGDPGFDVQQRFTSRSNRSD